MKKKVFFPGDPGFEYLDEEEKELIESIENTYPEDWVRIDTPELREKYAKMARETIEMRKKMKKNKTITVRISEYDLEKLKMKAVKEGLPYQTLLTSVVHKFVEQ